MSLDTLGISVEYLSTEFLVQVRSAGLTDRSLIYHLENLDGDPGIVRSFSANTVSPVDHRMGASYVHCLCGTDHVGVADVMLSYTWGYAIGDIVATLQEFCASSGRAPKETFVWICFLCVNQHRVVEQKKQQRSGMLQPKVDFFAEFGERVTGIGHILAMMSPWTHPYYLTRVWCIFEIYTAYDRNCQVTIVMPPDQMLQVSEDLMGDTGHMDKVYEVLANTKIEDAKASVERDKSQILDRIRSTCGYAQLNNQVNELLRNWINGVILDFVKRQEEYQHQTQEQISEPDNSTNFRLAHAIYCHRVSELMRRNGETNLALDLSKKVLGIVEKELSILDGLEPEQQQGFLQIQAASLNNLGLLLHDQGELEGAIGQYQEALSLHQKILDQDHLACSNLHNNIGSVLSDQGNYEESLLHYQKCLELQQQVLPAEHPDIAALHNNIGLLKSTMGYHAEALEDFEKAKRIWHIHFDDNHPALASLYHNTGSARRNLGECDRAMAAYEKALAIRIVLLGPEHPETADSYNSIGTTLLQQGDFDNALFNYRRALEIRQSKLGANHPDTLATCNNIAIAQYVAATEKSEQVVDQDS